MGLEGIPPVDPTRVPPVSQVPDAGDVLRKQREHIRQKMKKQPPQKEGEPPEPKQEQEDDDGVDVLV